MSRLININNYIGNKYGRLKVMYEVPIKNKGKRRVHCKCDCGNEMDADLYSLRRSFTRSCGCYNNEIRKVTCSSNFYKGSNTIIKYAEHAEVVIVDNNNNEKCRTIIDLDDVDKIIEYRWVFNGDYIMTNKTNDGNPILMHRFILPVENFVDHINHNKLDNRKCNLREATNQQNIMNSRIKSTNKSGFKGVSRDNKRNKWSATIGFNYKTIHLGRFNNKEDAIKARQEAELLYFGEFSPLHSVDNSGGDFALG